MSNEGPPRLEKNPGPDWLIEYRWLRNADSEFMSVFGMDTADEARAEAELSLDRADEPYVIVGITAAA